MPKRKGSCAIALTSFPAPYTTLSAASCHVTAKARALGSTDSLLSERARPNENVQRAMDYGSARAADQPAVHRRHPVTVRRTDLLSLYGWSVNVARTTAVICFSMVLVL